mmetsp:Transcript_30322/g.90365  ORF Transcript_30322/g.90365 Transcript_30322/m.90365 type:complete len:202 (+) Transcript_30322:2270-2875(+)
MMTASSASDRATISAEAVPFDDSCHISRIQAEVALSSDSHLKTRRLAAASDKASATEAGTTSSQHIILFDEKSLPKLTANVSSFSSLLLKTDTRALLAYTTLFFARDRTSEESASCSWYSFRDLRCRNNNEVAEMMSSDASSEFTVAFTVSSLTGIHPDSTLFLVRDSSASTNTNSGSSQHCTNFSWRVAAHCFSSSWCGS